MNPLNLWVALIELLILLGMAFGLGYGIAWLQYRKPIAAQQRTIQQIEGKLTRSTLAKTD